MNERYIVVQKQGSKLEVGDLAWLDEAESIYNDGGYFAQVVSVEHGGDESGYVSWVDVGFAENHTMNQDAPKRRYVIGTGSETEVLVLVERLAP